jgi:mono/diheme cytochrome c family protein|tara:strand:- start:1090 stop:1764 length:675 start_codon:yes stop_codon:yes gene_type:complete
MIHKITLYTTIAITAIALMTSCTTDPNSPGIEYMPDMYRSPAVEAYVDYGEDPFYVTEEVAAKQRNTMSVRKPVKGSIAFKGKDKGLGLPYAFLNTTEGYEKAGQELKSPLDITALNIEAGAANFELMCSHCHGLEGKGDGAISRNGHIMGIPDFSNKLKDLPEGKMYHTLMYGKGLMGSHASQISQKGLWQIIQYIQVLQNGGEMPTFDENGVALVTETVNNN